MDDFDRANRCYKTKDDKLHSTIFWRGDLSEETPQEREERLKVIKENRGTWVYDPEKRCVVRKEEIVNKEVDLPQISAWNEEWAVLATGRKMSKGQLKAYCKSHGKIWENG